jgi:heme A synthase
MLLSRFAKYAWFVLSLNLFVIVWGAFVRATGSGAGCGSHWPLCNGEVLPRAPALETIIEFSHRLTSGLALIAVVVLLIWGFRTHPRRHPVRLGALLSFILMIVEALIGAGLVLLELVAYNVSVARAFWMAGHLVNTFFLLAALTLTAWWASGGERLSLRRQGLTLALLALALLGMLILGASGAVTALGDTLVLGGGITPEESPTVAALVDLRIYHPLLAFIVGGFVAAAALTARWQRPGYWTRFLSTAVLICYVGQLVLGALNVALKAPVWLQLTHLLLSNLIWIGLVTLAAAALALRPVEVAQRDQTAALNSTASP